MSIIDTSDDFHKRVRAQAEEFARFLVDGCSKGKRRRLGDEVKGNCPLPEHSDKNPSFGYSVAKDAFACSCGSGLGTDLRQRLAFTPMVGPAPGRSADPVIARYVYRDENGTVLFRVCRTANKKFFQEHADGQGGWALGLNGTRRVPYQLPELVAGPDPVLVVEGEKDVDNARKIGFTATCNPHGAGKWRDEYSQHLKGRRSIVIPDRDVPGEEHAQRVLTSLRAAGAKADLLRLPGQGKDLSDWMTGGGTAEQLRALIDGTKDRGSVDTVDIVPGGWERPVPLDHAEVPPFPLDSLPTGLREWVVAEAEATQTPPDLAAFAALGVLASACAKKFQVEARPGWIEPLNLMLVTALPPGSRKSGVFAGATAPVYAYERQHHAAWIARYQEQDSAYKIAEKALRKAESEAAEAEGPDADAKRAKALERAREFSTIKRPAVPRLIADDTTSEKIVSMLAEQGGRLGIFSAEGGLFMILAGRYTGDKTPVIDAVLKGHCGDTIRVDRVGRPSESVASPALTICLTVQPAVIKNLADTPAFIERGLVARFLFGVPVSTVGRRRIDAAPVPEMVRLEYERIVRGLLNVPEQRGEDGEITATTMKFSDVGRAMLEDFMAQLEPRLGPDGDLSPLADWASKLAGALVRISGIIHLASHAGSASPPEGVSDEAVGQAIGLAEYLIVHARAAYQLLGGGHVGEARCILGKLQKAKATEFTKRQCHLAHKGHIKASKDLDGPLLLLQDHGFIRPAGNEPQPSKPGRPSERYEVNPLEQNPQNPQNPEGPQDAG